MREEYARGSLRRADLLHDPMQQFERWFGEATAASCPEANAMTIATVDDDGQPSVRTVLMKYFDAQGIVFFTNLESRKAREIDATGRVAALFFWQPLERQVSIRGRAEAIGTAESLKYFVTRPRGSQLGAWVSRQSSVISSRSLLENKLEEMRRKFGDGEIPLPSFWGGFRVRPEAVEFWQGGRDRLHDRFLYSLCDGDWTIERLSP